MAGFQDIVEVIDNSAWVFVARSGVSSKSELQELVAERRELLQSFPQAQTFPVWQAREHGWLADALSKSRLEYTEPLPTLLREAMSQGPDLAQHPRGRVWARHALSLLGFGPVDKLLSAEHRL